MNPNGNRGIALLRRSLRASAAAVLLGTAAAALALPGTAAAQEAPKPVEETNRYPMRMMLQVFDGSREVSHTQVAGFARMRRGDESWVMLDFGNGAVVIEKGGKTAVSRFRNTSGVEAGMRYNYATRTLSGGDPSVAAYHNDYVRPLLGKAPALGANAAWNADLTLAQLGFGQLGGQQLAIQLEREYFRHGGKDYVLLRYRVPSFVYTAGNRTIVQWGEGVALTDPGFGQMYWNATLHRAVASEPGAPNRPYRFAKTMAALDDKGQPQVDPRTIPQAAPHFARLYGASNAEIMGFVPDQSWGDQTPINLSAKLDVVALSLAEDSANQLGETSSSYVNGGRGNETPVYQNPNNPGRDAALDTADLSINALDTAVAAVAAGTASPAQYEIILRVVDDYGKRGQQLGEELKVAQREYRRIEALIDSTGGGDKHVFTELGKAAFDDSMRAKVALDDAKTANAIADKAMADVRWVEQSIEAAKAEGAAVTDTMKDTLAKAQQRLVAAEEAARKAGDVRQLQQEVARTEAAISALQDAKGYSVSVPSAATQKQIDQLKVAAQRVGDLSRDIVEYGKKGTVYAAELKKLPPSRAAELLERFKASGAGVALEGAAHTLNAFNVANALMNLGNAIGNDQSSGQLNLTYAYVDLSDPFNLTNAGKMLRGVGLDMIGMVSNALSGDAVGFFTDASVVATSSVTDLLVAMKGVQDINRLERELTEERGRMYNQRFIDNQEKLRKFYDTVESELAVLRTELADLDAEFDRTREMALALLEERRRNREEAERLAEAERQRLLAEARAENERIYRENLKRPPTAAEWAKFNADLAEAMKPDYPTAPPPTPEQVAERLRVAEERRRAEVEAAAAAVAEAIAAAARAAEEAAAAEAERQRVAEEAQARREREAEERRRRNDEAEARGLDIEPVEFEPPVWEPPVWEPPVWVPPEFDPPEGSEIPWTDFDDDNWLNDTENLAYNYENMSGTVATDLSRWSEWLATQNVRELTRLALLAGYPNLASALADAENIIRQSQDKGYRNWAMQAPSCGGYVGCGPSYLERWAQKSSIVRLGDILVQSREIFSTGGFTDIGISGLNLSYLLRDHSLQDGDIVQIRIRQFNRLIYEGRVSLTNAGELFNLPLQRGVASLEIYAENEGTSSPNTAQIRVENVVRGEGLQTYSLNTGQTATLRIESQAGSK